jgi:methionine-rich copper-binding protein CopC
MNPTQPIKSRVLFPYADRGAELPSDHQARRALTRFVRAVVTLLAASLMVVLTPVQAFAHAELLSVTPVDGSDLKSSPRSVVLTFNEEVSVVAGGVELLDATGMVKAKNLKAVNSTTITLTPKTLAKGRYVIRWAVISADGHPIVAASSFSIKSPTKAGKAQSFTFTDASGKTPARIDGTSVGRRTITFTGLAGEGEIELRHPLFKAPIVWKTKVSGSDLVASGLLPAAGTWQITMKIRTGPFDQLTRTTTLKIAK